MGCIHSKKDLNDINPNIYRVINVDADGAALWSGQLEISPKEITLYRKGKEPTKWSLQHLRRYGFDADVFTFEAGRRCTTGEGIYAFKCRRAESMFHLLQAYIQGTANTDERGDISTGNSMLNGPTSAMMQTRSNSQTQNNLRPNSLTQGQHRSANYVFPNSRTQSLSPNGTIHSSNPSRSTDTLTAEGNYLEPTPMRTNLSTRYSSGMRLSSVSSGPLSPEPNSPGSPNSFTNILEMAHLNHQPQYQNSNLYQEFPVRSGENNNNLLSKKLSLDIPPQEPAPILTAEQQIVQQNLNLSDEATSPIDNDPSHMYVNVTPGEMDSLISSGTPTAITTTTNQINFAFSRLVSTTIIDPSTRCYENLDPTEFRPLIGRTRFSKPDIFAKIDLPSIVTQNVTGDKSEPSTPTINIQNHKVNYIVLDLDQSPSSSSLITSANTSTTSTIISTTTTQSQQSLTKSSSSGSGTMTQQQQQSISSTTTTAVTTTATSTTTPNNNNSITTPTITGSSLLPPESPKKASLGYATIDFNKTVALSNSTAPSLELDSEGSRKTRHSSAARQSNSISD